jgi:YVTN family beta-propeller protein
VLDREHPSAGSDDDVSASPDGRTVYAIGWRWSGTVTQSFFVDAIDTHTDIVTASITLSNIEELTRIAVTPDGGHAYVIGDGGHVWVIDTVKNAVVATVPVASVADPLLGIAFTPDGTRAYVTCGNTGLIYVLDATTNHVVDTIQTDSPSGLAISRAM